MSLNSFLMGNKITVWWTLLFLPAAVILLSSSKALATSPMPHEIQRDIGRASMEKARAGVNDTVCSVRIVYVETPDTARKDFSASVVFEGPVERKSAIEKTIDFYEDELKSEGISEVVVECTFPGHHGKEK